MLSVSRSGLKRNRYEDTVRFFPPLSASEISIPDIARFSRVLGRGCKRRLLYSFTFLIVERTTWDLFGVYSDTIWNFVETKVLRIGGDNRETDTKSEIQTDNATQLHICTCEKSGSISLSIIGLIIYGPEVV